MRRFKAAGSLYQLIACLVKTRQIFLFGVAAIVALAFCMWGALKLRSNPQRAERIRRAYRPVRDDSTIEFTIENVGAYDGGAVAFGLVTKGTLHEGYRLQVIQESGEQRACICKAIAGLSKRLAEANSQGEDRNIGIWLDIPPAELKPYDRIISFDAPAAAHQVTPTSVQFSILDGVRN